MPLAQGAAVGVTAAVAQVARRAEDPGVERIPEAPCPPVESPAKAEAPAEVVAMVVAAGDPAHIGRPPVPVHVARGVDGAWEPEPAVAGMHVPAAVVVGEGAPGVASDPVQSGGSMRPAAPAVGLPIVLDRGLPGPAILDFHPLAVVGQAGPVAVDIDGRVRREAGAVTPHPLIQGQCGGAGPALELDPRVVETSNQERFTVADDHRAALGDDLREAIQYGDFGPAVAVALDLVTAPLLRVDPSVRRVDRRQLPVEQVVRDVEAQPAPVQYIEGVRVVRVR